MTRYGFAGAWGYEQPDAADALSPWGWQHVGARYYDPGVGRFMQRDPLGTEGGLNVYSYAGSSPVHHVDPSGLSFVIHWRPSGLSVGHTVIMTDNGVYISFVPSCGAAAIFGCSAFPGRTLIDDLEKYGIPDDIWYIGGLDEGAVGDQGCKWDGSRWTPQRNCIDCVFDCLGAVGGHVPPKPGSVWFPPGLEGEMEGYPGREFAL